MVQVIETGFIAILFAHILADFYFQSDKMARSCRKSLKGVAVHGAVYAAAAAPVLALAFKPEWSLLWLWLGMGAGHLLIDGLKFCICRLLKRKGKNPSGLTVFLADQCVHIAVLIVLWYVFGVRLTVRSFLEVRAAHLPVLPVTLALAVACVLRPVGLLIQNCRLWTIGTAAPTGKYPKDPNLNTGRIIGYLERLIILILVMYHQYSAIAFVLTAKSVARFKEIEESRITAEYYLIGTLMSAAATLVIAVLLGICGNGA